MHHKDHHRDGRYARNSRRFAAYRIQPRIHRGTDSGRNGSEAHHQPRPEAHGLTFGFGPISIILRRKNYGKGNRENQT